MAAPIQLALPQRQLEIPATYAIPQPPTKQSSGFTQLAPNLDMAAFPTSGSSTTDAILRELTSGTRFPNGDALLARITPCLENGKAALVQSLPKDTTRWGSTKFIVMRAKTPRRAAFTHLLAPDPVVPEHARENMTGSSGPQWVQVDALQPYALAFPPVEVVSAFGLLIEGMFSRIESARREACTLFAKRDALLPRPVSGKGGGCAVSMS